MGRSQLGAACPLGKAKGVRGRGGHGSYTLSDAVVMRVRTSADYDGPPSPIALLPQ